MYDGGCINDQRSIRIMIGQNCFLHLKITNP